MGKWAVFRDKATGQELAAYTIRGTFPGEAEADRHAWKYYRLYEKHRRTRKVKTAPYK